MTNHEISDKSYEDFVNTKTSDKSCEDFLNILKVFRMKTMKDYHGFNFKVNALVLTCVFEIFRKEPINSFQLDPAHYLSTPECTAKVYC